MAVPQELRIYRARESVLGRQVARSLASAIPGVHPDDLVVVDFKVSDERTLTGVYISDAARNDVDWEKAGDTLRKKMRIGSSLRVDGEGQAKHDYSKEPQLILLDTILNLITKLVPPDIALTN